jgi:hypothetical protein
MGAAVPPNGPSAAKADWVTANVRTAHIAQKAKQALVLIVIRLSREKHVRHLELIAADSEVIIDISPFSLSLSLSLSLSSYRFPVPDDEARLG